MRTRSEASDVLIWGVSRSGTTWILDVLAASPEFLPRYQPLHSYSFRPFFSSEGSEFDAERFLSLLADSEDPYLNCGLSGHFFGGISKAERGDKPRLLIKEVHFLKECLRLATVRKDLLLVFVIRDPVEVIESWWNTASEFQPHWSIYDEWRDAENMNSVGSGNNFGFSRWKVAAQAILEFAAAFPDRVTIVTYDQLLNHPYRSFGKLLAFLGVDDTSPSFERLDFVGEGIEHTPYSVFRAVDEPTHWRSLPQIIVHQIREEVENLEEYLQRIAMGIELGA